MDYPKHVVVTVVLKSVDPLVFDIESDDLPKDEKGNLKFCNDGHPGFQIEFELDDRTGLNYLFPPNKNKQDAIWSKMGASACPTSECHEVFKIQSVRPHEKSVVVQNANQGATVGDFGYTLQVTNTGGKPYLPLDPGGVNQNGPISRDKSTAALLLAGVALGVLGTLGTQALLMSG